MYRNINALRYMTCQVVELKFRMMGGFCGSDVLNFLNGLNIGKHSLFDG